MVQCFQAVCTHKGVPFRFTLMIRECGFSFPHDIGVVLRRRSGVAKERVSGYFGSGSDEMVMTDVYCGGSERHLTLCRHTSGPGVYCPHFASPAGVTCNFVGKSFEFMSN